jgi:hypothetical protein
VFSAGNAVLPFTIDNIQVTDGGEERPFTTQ